MKEKASPINIIWLVMILVSVAAAAWRGTMSAVSNAVFESGKSAVVLALGLIGAMGFWLGIMKVLEVAGALKIISKAVYPLIRKLFPEIPKDHPALSTIVLNIAANMLGLGNAATPIGIKAMQELDKINPKRGEASNAMCLFLAINTSSVTLLPLGVITIRASAGAGDPASILIPSLCATLTSTITAIIAAKLMQGKSDYVPEITGENIGDKLEEREKPKGGVKRTKLILILLFTLIFTAGLIYRVAIFEGEITGKIFIQKVSNWLVPVLIALFLLFGYFKGVKVYETLTEGAKEGFLTAIRIIPFMTAIFVAVGMFRASGALDITATLLTPLTDLLGMPAEALPMALIRPLSGSGAFGYMSEIVGRDPDSFLSYLVSVMQGSTETTFYVLAVYFGAIGIKNGRHALPAALCADAAGIFASLAFCRLFW